MCCSFFSIIGYGHLSSISYLQQATGNCHSKWFFFTVNCEFFWSCRDPSKGFFCYAQGYTTHFFCLASFLWTTTIAFTLHRTVVRHKTDVEDLEPMFHLYVWGIFFYQRQQIGFYNWLLLLISLFLNAQSNLFNPDASPGTSGVMTVIRSIANNHEHLSRLGTWCWAQTGHAGKASIQWS